MFEFSNQPLGIGQQLDASIRLTRSIYQSTLGVVAMLAIVGVLGALANVGIAPSEDGELPEFTPTMIVGLLIFLALGAYLYFLLMIRVVLASHDRGDLTDSVMLVSKKFLPLIVLYVLYMLAIIVGVILLVIPGMILAISLMLCFYCLILEDIGPLDALKRSHSLVWGNWMRTTVVVSVGGLFVMIVYLLIGFVTGLVAALSGVVDPAMVVNVFSAALTPFVQPYLVSLGLVIYHDVKSRKEGADISSELDSL